MKFVHMADVHIGGWREPKMSLLGIEAFRKAIDDSIYEKVDFVIIAGDLFNTSVPNIDYVKEAVKQLKKLKDNDISVYAVAGSHDFSPSGKTMLDVLEHAGLLINVSKAQKATIDDIDKYQLIFTIDQKTGVKITGMPGKKNMLEKSLYEALDFSNIESNNESVSKEDKQDFKVFIFHTALDELKTEELAQMDSAPLSLLPKGFDYYAGGHVHIIEHKSFDTHKNVIYPGPIFPNSFSELEKLHCGGYYLYDDGKISYKKLMLKEVVSIEIDCSNKTPEQVNSELIALKINPKDKIILIKLSGKLKLGRLFDISLKEFIHKLNEQEAYFVLKNTSSVSSADFEEIKKNYNPELVEDEIVSEHLGQIKIEGMDIDKEKKMIFDLMHQLSQEKNEGETNSTYEERILKDIDLL